MLTRLSNFIKRKDRFGYDIEINYKEGEEKKQTLIGGIVSIIVRAILLILVISKFQTMFLK